LFKYSNVGKEAACGSGQSFAKFRRYQKSLGAPEQFQLCNPAFISRLTELHNKLLEKIRSHAFSFSHGRRGQKKTKYRRAQEAE
jgi:hypothetical protein